MLYFSFILFSSVSKRLFMMKFWTRLFFLHFTPHRGQIDFFYIHLVIFSCSKVCPQVVSRCGFFIKLRDIGHRYSSLMTSSCKNSENSGKGWVSNGFSAATFRLAGGLALSRQWFITQLSGRLCLLIHSSRYCWGKLNTYSS